MTRITAFTALALWALCSGAHAAEHEITIDGYCDRLKFHLDRGRLVGVSNGRLHGQPCDDGFLSGTIATTASPVTPTGLIVNATSDFGQPPAQFIYYLDMTHHTFTLYGTPDGNTMFQFSGTWSDATMRQADASRAVASDRKITDHFFEKARLVRTTP